MRNWLAIVSALVGLGLAILIPTLMAAVPETPEFLLEQADEAFNARDFDLAEDLYEQARTSAKDGGQLSIEIEATAQRARCYLTQNQFDSARIWLDQAQAIAVPAEPAGWARFLGVRGRWEWRNDDNACALFTFAEMFEVSSAHDLAKHQIDAARMAAIVAPIDQQEEWALKGISLAKEQGEDKYLGPLWNNLGGSYCDLKRFDDAVAAYANAREYHWRFGNEMNKFWADYSVGYALRLAAKYDEAMSWFNPCLAWAERMGNHAAMGHTCEQIGEIELALGDTAQCLSFFKSALQHYSDAGYAEHSAQVIADIDKRIEELK